MVLDYLYYKLYKAAEKSSLRDISEFIAAVFLGGLLSCNTLVASALLAKFDILPFLFPNSGTAGTFAFLLIVAVGIIYASKKRYRKVIKRYSSEPNEQRIRGNIIVGVYVAISYLAIFAVAFFKPGEL